MAAPPPTSAASVVEAVPLRSHVCLPGDVVLGVGSEATVAVGGGLRPFTTGPAEAQQVWMLATVCAPVERAALPGNAAVPRYTLESPAAHRYCYAVGDPVVAVIARKVSNFFYYCHTGGPALASLDAMAFDGATKTSRPRLVEGDVLFARVQSTGRDTGREGGGSSSGEPELSCTAAEVGLAPKDWTSGESVFGPLTGGRLLTVPLPYARSLLTPCDPAAVEAADEAAATPASYLLVLLGRRVPFDVCVGMNGLVWVRGQPSAADPAAEARRTIAVCACITEAQYDVSRTEMTARVASYFSE